MEEDPQLRQQTDKILEAIRNAYGFVPVVNQVLSERPDLFIPGAAYSRAVLEADGDLDKKTRYLCAISAATAAGGEYCVAVQMKHAREAGATKDEILESIVIGSMMAMTRAQSYALRKFADEFEVKLDQ